MVVTSSHTTPDSFKVELRSLEDEIESHSEALPPDDKTLDAWSNRLDKLWDAIRPLRREARNRLWVVVQRIGTHIESLREATASFHAGAASLDRVDPVVGGAARTALSSAISGALAGQLASGRSSVAETRQKPREKVLKAARTLADNKPEGDVTRGTAQTTHPKQKATVPKSAPTPIATARPKKQVVTRANQVMTIAPESTQAASVQLVPAMHRALRTPAARSQRTDPIVAYVGRLARRDTFDEACAIACAWLRSRRFKLPDDISSDFECKGPGADKVVVVRYEGIWAMQADTFDRGPYRRWRVEMVLLQDAQAAPAVSLVLHTSGPVDQPVPEPTVPRLAGELIDKIGLIDLRDGATLSTAPEHIESEADVDGLVAKLRSRDRQHPIILQSQYLKEGVAKTLLDPVGLAEKLRGLAHVVTLGREHFASWALTDRLSKRFSVFGASLRMYRPGFTTEDDPDNHPLWTPTVLHQRNVDLGGLQGELLREAAASSLVVLGSGDAVPAFDDVQKKVLQRRIAKAQARQQAPTDMASFRDRITELERAVEEANALAGIFSKEKDQLQDELARVVKMRDTAAAKVSYLDDRVRMLEELNSAAAGTRVELPDSWDGLEDWAMEHLGKRIVITPKAMRAARRSVFENIPFAYEVLLLLANTYVPCRRGELKNGKDALEQELLRLGVEISSVGNAVQTHRWRDTYSTPYKSGQVPLDMHVSGRNNRDPRYGFRLYFHWDDDEKCVVVGSFPSHLDNSLS